MAYEVRVGERSYRVTIQPDTDPSDSPKPGKKEETTGKEGRFYRVQVDDRVYRVDLARPQPALYSLIIAGRSYEVEVGRKGDLCQICLGGEAFHAEVIEESLKALRAKKKQQILEGEQKICSSMPGKVIGVLVQKGQGVQRGEGLVIIQAMKMENELKAPKDGEIKEIFAREGQKVEGGEVLLILG